jgi:hypothetical protein
LSHAPFPTVPSIGYTGYLPRYTPIQVEKQKQDVKPKEAKIDEGVSSLVRTLNDGSSGRFGAFLRSRSSLKHGGAFELIAAKLKAGGVVLKLQLGDQMKLREDAAKDRRKKYLAGLKEGLLNWEGPSTNAYAAARYANAVARNAQLDSRVEYARLQTPVFATAPVMSNPVLRQQLNTVSKQVSGLANDASSKTADTNARLAYLTNLASRKWEVENQIGSQIAADNIRQMDINRQTINQQQQVNASVNSQNDAIRADAWNQTTDIENAKKAADAASSDNFLEYFQSKRTVADAEKRQRTNSIYDSLLREQMYNNPVYKNLNKQYSLYADLSERLIPGAALSDSDRTLLGLSADATDDAVRNALDKNIEKWKNMLEAYHKHTLEYQAGYDYNKQPNYVALPIDELQKRKQGGDIVYKEEMKAYRQQMKQETDKIKDYMKRLHSGQEKDRKRQIDVIKSWGLRIKN